MSFAIRSVLGDSLYQLFSRNGLILVTSMFFVNLIFQIGLSSLFIDMWREFWPEFVETYPEFEELFGDPDALYPLAIDMPSSLALAIVVVAILLMLIVLAVSIRVFYARDEDTIRTELIFDNIAWVTVNLFVGMVIFGILWFVGLLLLIIPGIFIYVSLIYFIAVVSVEDRSFIDGFSRSWALVRGLRFKVFLLFLSVFLISLVAAISFAMVTSIVHFVSPLAGTVFDQLWDSLITLYFAAVIAISYRALTEPVASPDEPAEETPEDLGYTDQDAHW